MAQELSRRSALKLLASSTSALAISVTSPTETAAKFALCNPKFKPKDESEFRKLVETTPIIDVHCHIFNALDIPAYQYIEKVIGMQVSIDRHIDKTPSLRGKTYTWPQRDIDAVHDAAETFHPAFPK